MNCMDMNSFEIRKRAIEMEEEFLENTDGYGYSPGIFLVLAQEEELRKHFEVAT